MYNSKRLKGRGCLVYAADGSVGNISRISLRMRLIAYLWILEAPYIGEVKWLIIVFKGFKINTRLWNYFSRSPLFSVSKADIFLRRSVWVSLITYYIPLSFCTISLISGQSRALTNTNARSRVRIVSVKILFILSIIPFRVRGEDIWHKTVIKWVHLIIIFVLKSSALPRFFSKIIWSTVSMIRSAILSWYFYSVVPMIEENKS